MANEITGRETIVAFKKATVWRAPVACGAGDGLLILKDGITPQTDRDLDDSAGQEWIAQADDLGQEVKGPLEFYMRYEGFDVLMAMVMGIAGVPTQQDATAAYVNTYGLASSIKGLFGTLAQKKLTDKIWEFPSVKPHGFKLSAEMNKPVMISIEGIADILDRASTTNTIGSMAAVTMPDRKNRIIMNKNTFVRINDQSGGALADGDKVYPSAIEFSLSRPMDGEPVAGQDGIDEPIDDGFPTIICTMKFPRYNTANDAFFDDLDASTAKKMDINFGGKVIEGAYNYGFGLSMPHVKINNPQAQLGGAGKIPMSLSFDILAALAAPSGMTHTTPFQIDVTNTRTTDPLA